MSESKAYRQAGNLIDAEFEALDCMDKQDLWEYLASAIPDLTRKESDKLWDSIFKCITYSELNKT